MTSARFVSLLGIAALTIGLGLPGGGVVTAQGTGCADAKARLASVERDLARHQTELRALQVTIHRCDGMQTAWDACVGANQKNGTNPVTKGCRPVDDKTCADARRKATDLAGIVKSDEAAVKAAKVQVDQQCK